MSESSHHDHHDSHELSEGDVSTDGPEVRRGRSSKVHRPKASVDGSVEFRVNSRAEAVIDGVVGRNDDRLWSLVWEERAFDFRTEGVPVGPELEMVTEKLSTSELPFVKEDNFLACIPVPPVIERLKEM